MIPDEVLRILKLDNSWLWGGSWEECVASRMPERLLHRSMRLRIGGRVCLVVGPRQVGKSTLIWTELAERKRPALLVNCEEVAVRDWLGSPALFLSDLAETGWAVDTVVFEEVQWLPDAGLFLKGLVDRPSGISMLATASSSFDLEARTRESLAGRADRHLLLPISLDEMAGEVHGPPVMTRERLARIVEHATIFGGYPTAITASDPPDELAGLVEAFIVRDASDRFRIRHIPALRHLLEIMASQVGNLANFSEWASLTGVSNDTVRDHARLLEETHVVRLVRPFVGGRRAELTSAPKVYFVDNGIRNRLFGGFGESTGRADRGALLENLVLGELLKCTNPLLDDVLYWRSKSGAEVDLVLRHGGRLLACEVKAGDTRGRLTRSARSFIDAYEPQVMLVVHSGEEGEAEAKGTGVRFVRPPLVARHVGEFLSGD